MEESADARAWNEHYKRGQPGWDLKGPPQVLTDLIKSLPEDPLRVLVPCAGYAHDAIAWAKGGHEVLAVDFAPLAVKGGREQAASQGVSLSIKQADLFHPDSHLENSFDIVWEQTCLAAIAPGQRSEYFRIMATALKPNGKFFGLLWNHGRPGGPPFDMSVGLINANMAPHFEIFKWDWIDSAIAKRKKEFLIELHRK
jgi:SAM-dependent methyltransferase